MEVKSLAGLPFMPGMRRAAHETQIEIAQSTPSFERASGVFRCVAPARPETTTAESIAREAHAVTRTWTAVLLAPSFAQTSRASILPAPPPARAHDGAASLVVRLSTWLRGSEDEARVIDVPSFVRAYMPVDVALVLPVQSLHTMGWIAIPSAGATHAIVRALESIGAAAALELERADRRARIAALAQ